MKEVIKGHGLKHWICSLFLNWHSAEDVAQYYTLTIEQATILRELGKQFHAERL